MSGQVQWTRDSDGVAHPDDSILLAYTRHQSLGRSSPHIYQHIAGCGRCKLRCQDLGVTSKSITDMLATFESEQYYSPITERVLECIQDPAVASLAYRKRQQARLQEDLAIGKVLVMMPFAKTSKMLNPEPRRPRNNTLARVRIFSIPAIVFLLVLAVFIALAFAFSNNVNWRPPFHSSVSTIPGAVQPTIAIPNPTASGTPSSALTTHKPTIKSCTVQQPGKNVSLIGFCGSNFTPGDKVGLSVEIDGNKLHTRHVTIDAQGNFQVLGIINNCRVVQNATVSVGDVKHPVIVSQVIPNVQLGKCSA
jgi:hypothetical protein